MTLLEDAARIAQQTTYLRHQLQYAWMLQPRYSFAQYLYISKMSKVGCATQYPVTEELRIIITICNLMLPYVRINMSREDHTKIARDLRRKLPDEACF
jgi:hypothetical protein